MNTLSNRVIVVTGAHGRIGSAVATACAVEGATVILVARTHNKLESLATHIRERGGVALPYAADVTCQSAVEALFLDVIQRNGRIDTLVNAAGIMSSTPTDALSLDEWQHVMLTNVTSAFLCCREAFKSMKTTGGHIINVGSISAKVPRPNAVAYTTSKFALEGLTRSLALDGRAHGICVSIVHPGLTTRHTDETPTSHAHVLTAADVAKVILMIASMPPTVHVFDVTVLPLEQTSFVGRG